jgi:hypothetical protein
MVRPEAVGQLPLRVEAVRNSVERRSNATFHLIAHRSGKMIPEADHFGLTGFFALLSLSGSGISNFSVVALTGAFGTPLSAANLALTGYLSAQALGVLLGGFISPPCRGSGVWLRHRRLYRSGDRHDGVGRRAAGRPCAAPGCSAV